MEEQGFDNTALVMCDFFFWQVSDLKTEAEDSVDKLLEELKFFSIVCEFRVVVELNLLI